MSETHDEHLLQQAELIASAIGKMFPGLCEVVLHDLRDEEHSIRAIENNLSGRTLGDPATELGVHRIRDPEFPAVIQNYANEFPDGRPVKSTSIGIRSGDGQYIGALCLNLDVSALSPLVQTLSNLVSVHDDSADRPAETLRGRQERDLRAEIEAFAAQRTTSPRALDRNAKRELVQQLGEAGYFEMRASAKSISNLLGISRATVYNYAK